MVRLLKEGGEVFKDGDGRQLTQRINQSDVKPTLAWLEQLTGLDLLNNTLGSTGLKPTSGDLDVAIDANEITPDQLKARLEAWCKAQKLNPQEYVKRTGSGTHFKTPIMGNPNLGYVQTDFMFMKNMGVGKFFLTAPANSEYKGQDRNILVNSIAKALGYKLSQREGILDRASNKVVATDPDKIAKLLLNPSATKDDLYSVETIVDALKNDPRRDEKLAQAREHFKQEGIPFFENTDFYTPVTEVSFMARLRDRIVNQGMQVIVEQTLKEDARISHIEDLVFEKGSRGVQQALAIIADAQENTSGTTTIKWDGKPAIIFGRKPDGEFVLTDKAGFTAKGYDGLATSPQEIAAIMNARGPNRGELIGIYEKLFPLLRAATPEKARGYFKGDLLYSDQPPQVAGNFVFKPNFVEYKIPVASELGQRIGASEVGIAMHTKIADPGSPEEPIGKLNFNPVQGLLLVEPQSKLQNVKAENKQVKQIKSILSAQGRNIDQLFNPAELKQMKISDLPALCQRYINSRINSNFDNLLPEFGDWLQKTVTPSKFKNIIEYLQSPTSNTDAISAAFSLFLLLHEVKMNLLQQLDNQSPGQEGWVMATPSGRAKLVNRFGFSAGNRAQNNPKP